MNSKTLRVNFSVNPESFHPHLSSDTRTCTLGKALYETLTRVNEKKEVELAAAEKLEISSCETIYTFTLRDTKWSNGEDLTSYHFADAWKLALDPKKSRCIKAMKFFLIKNAKKVYQGKLPITSLGIHTPSKKKLVLELEHPASFFLQLLADPVFSPLFDPLSKKDPSIFNGPFILDKYELNKKIVLLSNPFYWDSKSVALQKIEIYLIKMYQNAFSMFKKGDLDFLGSPFESIPPEHLINTPNIKFKQSSSPFWIFCNVKNPKLKSFKIRKALSFSIDRKELLKHILPAQKEALYSMIPNKLSNLEDKIPILSSKECLELFKEGLNDLKIKKESFSLTLNHTGSPEQKNIAIYLKHHWEKVFGIQINLLKNDWNTLLANFISGNYELAGCFYSNLCDDPFYFLESFNTCHNNYANWEHLEYQTYFQASNQNKNEKQRKYFLKKTEEILFKEMPMIPIYNHGHLFLSSDRIEGLEAPEFNYIDFKWVRFKNSKLAS